jgi:hypothetical protein
VLVFHFAHLLLLISAGFSFSVDHAGCIAVVPLSLPRQPAKRGLLSFTSRGSGPRAIIKYSSARALIQRINRKLHNDSEQLRTARTVNSETRVGKYFVVDTFRNAVTHTDVDIEALGRELEVLHPWEELEAQEVGV